MVRDFTYTDDLVKASTRLIAAPPRAGEPVGCSAASLSPASPRRVVNFGGGNPTKLMDHIGAMERAIGRTA